MRRSKAEQVQMCDSVAVVQLMIEIDIRPIGHRGLRIGKRVMDRNLRFAEEPAQHVNSCHRHAAVVCAQIQHDVFDGAVLAGDLTVCLNDQAERVRGGVRQLALRVRFVIVQMLVHLESVQADIGGIVHFVIPGHRFGMLHPLLGQ